MNTSQQVRSAAGENAASQAQPTATSWATSARHSGARHSTSGRAHPSVGHACGKGEPTATFDLPGRRTFLLGAAAATGAVVLAACSNDGNSPDTNPSAGTGGSGDKPAKGSVTTPPAKPAAFTESPKTQKRVDSGTLPKIEDRIPDEPYVVPHNWVRPGKWGGQMKMNIAATSGGDAGSIAQWWYSFSMLRFLNDGQDVGPGLAHKWKSNADATEWSFTLRSGLHWSDGHPVTTDDVLFWWNDMANYESYTGEAVPDECKSGKGTICKLRATDSLTFTMTFDAPAPLTADRVVLWPNGPGGNGPTWIVPAHYAKKFHPKYTKVPKSWASPGGLWEQKVNYKYNPSCPTLTPFQLSKYNDGRSLVWERNPYSYEVMPNGDHLPYLDGIIMSAVSDPEVGKLKITSGQVDVDYSAYSSIVLGDVSTLNKAKDKAGIDILMWDSGNGTGSIFFASLDYVEKKYRDLFGKPKFRQALSLAFDRAAARKAIYFQTGEATTGTMSPKAMEWHVNHEGEQTYQKWRDSYLGLDVDKARSLLDELGLTDSDQDGFREFPDGSELELRIDRPADASAEHVAKDNQLKRDWAKVGIKLRINPVPPTSFADNWAAGKYMCHSDWALGDGPNCLIYPQWIVPIGNARWAPLQGQMYASRGTPAYTSEKDVDPWKRHPPRRMPEDGSPVAKLWKLYDSTRVEPDQLKRVHAVWEMTKIHIAEGPFFQGTVANYPQIFIKKKDMKNVPVRDNLATGGYAGPWTVPCPAVYSPETFYWDNPDDHQA